MSNNNMNEQTATTTPTWQIVVLWFIVGLPALWGFIETLSHAMRLFTG